MNIKKFIINQLNKSDRNVNLTQENLKQKQYKDNIDNKEKINEIIDELGAIDGDISNINNDIAAINTSLNGKVSKSGDTMTGMLTIDNVNSFDGVKKYRTIDGNNYSISVAIGADKAGKVQYQKNGTTVNGLKLNEDGTIYNDKTGNQLIEVEKVTGTNGTALKYSNGIMICYGTITQTINISSLYEGVYFGGINDVSFPVIFTETPTIAISLIQNSSLLSANISVLNSNKFSTYIWKSQSKSNVSVSLKYVAIGSWK